MRKKLKELRLKEKMTQEQIAKRAGIHRAHYTNIERGNSNPSMKVMLAIKDALGTERDDIFLTNDVEYTHETNQPTHRNSRISIRRVKDGYENSSYYSKIKKENKKIRN